MAWPTHGFDAAAVQAYRQYCGIISGCTNANTREGLAELSRVIDGMRGLRYVPLKLKKAKVADPASCSTLKW
ncbi:hypothetical protein ABZP36_000718 [Zizania latifolia]